MSNLFNHDLNQTQEDTEGQVLVLYKTPETISALDELDTCFSGLRKDLQDVANPQRQSNGIIEVREHDSLRQHLVTDTSRTNTGSVEPASENIFIANPVSVNNICKELTKTLSKPLKSTLPPVGFNFAFIRKKVKKIGLLDKLDQLQPLDYFKSLPVKKRTSISGNNNLKSFVKFVTNLNLKNNFDFQSILSKTFNDGTTNFFKTRSFVKLLSKVELDARNRKPCIGFQHVSKGTHFYSLTFGAPLSWKEFSLIRNPSCVDSHGDGDDDDDVFGGKIRAVEGPISRLDEELVNGDEKNHLNDSNQMASEADVSPGRRALVLLKKLNSAEVRKFTNPPNEDSTKKKLKCEECSLTFPTPVKLYLHTLTRHTQTKDVKRKAAEDVEVKIVFTCRQCDQTFVEERHMKNHLNIAHGVTSPFACLLCNVTFETPISMKLHLQQIHETFDCKVCQKSFSSKLLLQHHSLNQHDKSISEFKCKFCSKTFNKFGFLQRHLATFHEEADKKKSPSGETKQKAANNNNNNDQSKNGRKDSGVVKINSRRKSNVTEIIFNSNDFETFDTFECAVCSQHFKTLADLNKHKDEEHKATGTRAPFRQLSLDKIKVEKIVSGEPVQIPTAPIIVSKNSPSSLKVRDMSALQFFKCKKCAKFFVNAASYEQHLKSAHQSPVKADVKTAKELDLKINNTFRLTPAQYDHGTPTPKDTRNNVKVENKRLFEESEYQTTTTTKKPSARISDILSTRAQQNMAKNHRKRKDKEPEVTSLPSVAKRSKYYVSTKIQEGFKCELCGKSFDHKGFYHKHLRQIHKVTPIVAVQESEPTAPSKVARTSVPPLNRGSMTLTPKREPGSAKSVELSKKIKSEPETKNSNNGRMNLSVTIKCITCNRSFGSNNELVRHMQLDHATPDQRDKKKTTNKKKADAFVINCGFCFKAFERQEDIMEHINEEHTKQISDSKQKNGSKGKTSSTGAPSKGRCQSNKSAVTCTVCEKLFVSQLALDVHMKSDHAGLRKIKKTSSNPGKSRDSFSSSNFTVKTFTGRPTTADGVKKDKHELDIEPQEISMPEPMDPLSILQRELDEIDQTLNKVKKGAQTQPTPTATNNSIFEKPNPRNKNCIVIEL